MSKILIVDDEPDIRTVLEFNFAAAGYEVRTAPSAAHALEIIALGGVSLIVLDIMMGGMTGIDMAYKLRKSGNATPIIFLTALDTESDILAGFKSGGDDYMAKPFSIKELLARVAAVLARTGSADIITACGIELNTTDKTVKIGTEAVTLTKTEFLILYTLIKKVGRVYSREELISKVWGSDIFIEPRTVDVHIARLRKKLGDSGVMIVNRSGYGYCLEN